MSYNALIVDDEPMIRFGLASCVNWESEGVRLAGEASNGHAALEIIKEQEIHILITDIKMPLMDGLELIRHAKEHRPHLKVVLVSSYSDFSYAVEAVKLGVVVDYLLKPTMEPEDLLRVIRTCKERLDNDQTRSEQDEWLRQEEKRSKLQQFEDGLKAYLGGENEAFLWKPDWAIGNLAIAVWRISEEGTDGKKLKHIVWLDSVRSKLNAWCRHSLTFVSGEEELVTLIADSNGSALTDLNLYHRRLSEEGEHRFTVGVSPVVHRLHAVGEAYEWAKGALDHAFFEGKGKCYLGRIAAAKGEAKGEEKEERQDGDYGIERLREAFSKAYAFADKAGSQAAFDDHVALWRSKRHNRTEIVSHARSLLMIMWSHHFRIKTEEHIQIMLMKLEGLEHAESLNGLIRAVQEELSRFWEPEEHPIAVDAGGAHVIQLALSYIQEHYRGDISLQDVADYVHMSKNYFSEQFKQRTGMNFIEFVIRLRLHYAKHLLEHTSMKVMDIGSESGFNSPKHFLKLFKREMNCTPAEYRERCERQRAGGSHSEGGTQDEMADKETGWRI